MILLKDRICPCVCFVFSSLSYNIWEVSVNLNGLAGPLISWDLGLKICSSKLGVLSNVSKMRFAFKTMFLY